MMDKAKAIGIAARFDELPGRVIGRRHTPGQNDAPDYYVESPEDRLAHEIAGCIIMASYKGQEELTCGAIADIVKEKLKPLVQQFQDALQHRNELLDAAQVALHAVQNMRQGSFRTAAAKLREAMKGGESK